MVYELRRVEEFHPPRKMVETRRRAPTSFRPAWARTPVTNAISSCCFNAGAFEDYLNDYHGYAVPDKKWGWRLQATNREDLFHTISNTMKLEFWAVEDSNNIGATYCLRFDDSVLGHQQATEFGSPTEIAGGTRKFRDGDLCYVSRPKAASFEVVELMFVETICGKKGFVHYGTHTWVTSLVNEWKNASTNLVGVHNLDWQQCVFKVYKSARSSLKEQ